MIKLEKTALGIELGSTRVKAVLIDDSHRVLASGEHTWENRFENGFWTYNYVSGEHITDVPRGRPMFIRTAESGFSLANFMRANIYSAFASLRLGMDILTKEEQVKIDSVIAHGGIFKTKGVAQRFLAAALKVPVSVNETSNEGGPFGMAALAMYMLKGKGMSLEDYLDSEVFGGSKLETIVPDDGDMQGFDKFMNRFANCLDVVRLAAEKEE